jgi:hypothetical protein
MLSTLERNVTPGWNRLQDLAAARYSRRVRRQQRAARNHACTGTGAATVGPMGESFQRGDRRSQRLDDELVRDPGDEEETPDAELWDRPGHDGIVTDADSDPDRVDLRSEIGQYVRSCRSQPRWER